MGHHDLYASLSLDRNAPPSVLAGELDHRIAWARDRNPEALEELSCARAILGDPGLRTEYDRMLADPTGPTVTPDTLRQLASRATVPAPPPVPAPVPVSLPRRGGAVRVLVPVLALVLGIVLGVGGVLLFGKDATDATDGEDGEDTVISEGDRDRVQSLSREFLGLRTSDEVLDWAEEHFDRRVRNEMIEQLGARGDMRDFDGVENMYGGSDLTVGPSTEFTSVITFQSALNGGTMQDTLDAFSRDRNFGEEDLDSALMVGVFDGGGRARGIIIFIDVDGGYKLGGFAAATGVDSAGGWDV